MEIAKTQDANLFFRLLNRKDKVAAHVKTARLTSVEYEWNSGSYLRESLDGALALRNRLGWEVFTILPSLKGVDEYLFVVLRRIKQ